jgi:Ethanolamine utilization protein EutJ (predicted chaperonin)
MTFAADRALRRAGIEVDLYRYEVDEASTTSRGTPAALTDDSPKTILAIPDPGGKSVSYGVYGVEVDADQVYLVHETEPVDDGGGDGASRIVQDGDVYVVLDADSSQQHGFLVLECERDTESDLP